MKIITLNIWGGKVEKPLLDFFKKYSDVDIFLLQEVYNNATERTSWEELDSNEILGEINEVLKDHKKLYAPTTLEECGLAVFVKKDTVVKDAGDIFVFRSKDSLVGRDITTLGKNLQYIKIINNEIEYTVINFHGLWNGKGKTDTEDRINQSKKIIDFVKNIKGNIVFGGDFNLLPSTESLKMLEKELGLRNLITENNIQSTRTSFYKKPDKFADYFLITPSLKVKDFKVLPDEVSDHSALFLEI